MLTTTMKPDEVLREMLADQERLRRRLSHEQGRWRRWLLKHKGMERTESSDWTSPATRNRWVWGVRLHDAKFRDMGLLTGVLSWVDEGAELYLLLPGNADYGLHLGDVTTWQDAMGHRDVVLHFTAHSLLRLRERWPQMRRLYGLDLVQQVFFMGERRVMLISDNRDGQNRTGQHIEHPVRITMGTGGVFLGEKLSPTFFRMNTFIAHGQTYGEQREVLGHQRQRVLEAEREA